MAWTVSRRRSGAEMRGCLLAATTFLLFAVALWAQAARQHFVTMAAFLLGTACALLWFCHIYTQSLHNTTM